MAITWAQRTVSQLPQRILNAIGECARLKEGEIARPELVARLNRNAHTFYAEILVQLPNERPGGALLST